jgi:hypothetical protein
MLAAISTCDIISKQNELNIDLKKSNQINEQKISIYPNPSCKSSAKSGLI